MIDQVRVRLSTIRARLGERWDWLLVLAAVVAVALVGVAVGPIVWYLLHDRIQEALFRLFAWCAVSLVVVGVYVAARRLLLFLPERERFPERPSEPAPSRAPTTSYQTMPAASLPVAASRPGPLRSGGREGHTLTWAELVSAGIITPERQYIGWDMIAGAPVYASWEGLRSLLLTGMSGSGKTVFALSKAAQTCSRSLRPCLVVGDCMQGTPRSLVTRMAPLEGFYIRPPERDPAGILELARELEALMSQRIDDLARGEHVELYPILGVFEEWPELMKPEYGIAGELEPIVASIARRGSHVGVDVIICSQDGTKEAIGDLHKLIPSRIAFRNASGHARFTLGHEVKTELYADGRAAMTIRGLLLKEVQCPEVTARDLARVAGLLPRDTPHVSVPTSPPPLPSHFPGVVIPFPPPLADDFPEVASPPASFSVEALIQERAGEILTALREGTPPWKVARDYLPGPDGQTVKGGAPLQRRVAAVEALGRAHGLLPPAGDGPPDTEADPDGRTDGDGTEERAGAGADTQTEGPEPGRTGRGDGAGG